MSQIALVSAAKGEWDVFNCAVARMERPFTTVLAAAFLHGAHESRGAPRQGDSAELSSTGE